MSGWDGVTEPGGGSCVVGSLKKWVWVGKSGFEWVWAKGKSAPPPPECHDVNPFSDLLQREVDSRAVEQWSNRSLPQNPPNPNPSRHRSQRAAAGDLMQHNEERLDEYPNLTIKISLSYIEIYNEKVRDLLERHLKVGACLCARPVAACISRACVAHGVLFFPPGLRRTASGVEVDCLRCQGDELTSRSLYERDGKVYVRGLSRSVPKPADLCPPFPHPSFPRPFQGRRNDQMQHCIGCLFAAPSSQAPGAELLQNRAAHRSGECAPPDLPDQHERDLLPVW